MRPFSRRTKTLKRPSSQVALANGDSDESSVKESGSEDSVSLLREGGIY